LLAGRTFERTFMDYTLAKELKHASFINCAARYIKMGVVKFPRAG
jgi:hypothetical protein